MREDETRVAPDQRHAPRVEQQVIELQEDDAGHDEGHLQRQAKERIEQGAAAERAFRDAERSERAN